jgi:thioredoxin 1
MSSDVLAVTDGSFEQEIAKADLPVMLDLWAPWCGPCRMVSPTIEELARENEGRLKACKMDVDQNQQTAGKFGVTAIPTVLFFQDGEEVESLRLVGAQPKDVYQRAIDSLLNE